jgi:hypothetical protein
MRVEAVDDNELNSLLELIDSRVSSIIDISKLLA